MLDYPVVSHIRSKPFKIEFCTDLLPENKPFFVQRLQFNLCKEDVIDIASGAGLSHLRTMLICTQSLDKLTTLSANSSSLAGRRTHVLVGQSVLDDLSLYEHAKLHVAYDYDFGIQGIGMVCVLPFAIKRRSSTPNWRPNPTTTLPGRRCPA